MLVTLLGITVFLQPATSVLLAVSIMALQPSRLSYTLLSAATVMLSRPEHSPNASYPMLVTLLGISTLVRPKQLWNAPTPMLVTLLGISMLVRPEQPWNTQYPMLVTLLGISMLVRPEQL